ncbi:lactonase family protein [Marinactinospora thermotolerans]|uniref:6-phosphogluconolactonase, cycloisomerase 2 family n=1 Tax=Marinactinospora thermotolerans DSM 45154 TaxID=1122192 RepID=A0A1T4RRK9_9ACTN|nr:lactonase family protein [Marinactinospora thermotolerans]SKA18572.1 6-phosphogluconolactonase, cycloisomerase 2 family [Marinactinospora thermotolerans DSM 45154]
MAERRLLWIGTYTPGCDPAGDGSGVHRVWLDPRTGELSGGQAAGRTDNPSFLAAHPTLPYLYAVNERPDGGVCGFAVEGEELRLLGEAPTGGGSPCHLLVHPAGRHVITANYADGVVSVHPIGPDGAPQPAVEVVTAVGSGPDADRQEGPHAHSVVLAPDGRHLLVADLGTDELRALPFDPDAADPLGEPTVAARLAPGTGPRHVAVGSSGHLYVAGELDSRVHVLRWNGATATAERIADLPATSVEGERNYPAEIALTHDGALLHVSNRGADTIATFRIDPDTGVPHPLAETPVGVRWPRHFAQADGYLVVGGQQSGELSVLRVDPETGIPTDTGHRFGLPDPVCVLPATPR